MSQQCQFCGQIKQSPLTFQIPMNFNNGKYVMSSGMYHCIQETQDAIFKSEQDTKTILSDKKQPIFTKFAVADAKKVFEQHAEFSKPVCDGEDLGDKYQRVLQLAFDVPDELFELISNFDLLNFPPDLPEKETSFWKYGGSDIDCLIKLALALFERRDSYGKIELHKKELFTDFYKDLAEKYPTAQDYIDRVNLVLGRTNSDEWVWEDANVLREVVWKTKV